MRLALFDLDNTLLAGDSDYEWAQFLIEEGVLERDSYEARNREFFEQYKAGILDIREFLDFQLKPLAQYPRATLDAPARAGENALNTVAKPIRIRNQVLAPVQAATMSKP